MANTTKDVMLWELGDGKLTIGTAIEMLVDMKTAIEDAKAEYDKLMKKLKEAMITTGFKKLETDFATITYKEPTERETFDSKAFRADHPDEYDEYVKLSPVSDSIVIKLK